MYIVLLLESISDIVFINAELQVNIVSNLCAFNLHLHQTKSLQSFDNFAESACLDSHLPPKNISDHRIASVLYIVEGNTLAALYLQLLE